MAENKSATRGRGKLLQLLGENAESSQSKSTASLLSYGRGSTISSDSGFKGSETSSGHSFVSFARGKSLNVPSQETSSASSVASAHTHAARNSGGRGKGILSLLNQIKNAGSSTESQTESNEPVDIPLEEESPVSCSGTKGEKVQLSSNWVRIALSPEKEVFEYDVKFEPNVVSKMVRVKLLSDMEDIIGNIRSFDGAILWLPIKLPDKNTVGHKIDPLTGKNVTVTIRYHKRSDMMKCIHLYNVLFNKCAKQLKMAMVHRNYYLPSESICVPQHQIEIWPGYVFAAHYQKGGAMLNIDVSHKLLRLTTVYEAMGEITQNTRGPFQEAIKEAVIGSVVLTRYNSRTYRIDDVDFNLNPMSTFETSDGKMTTYYDYYKNSYGFNINDRSQPLLVSIQKRRENGSAEKTETKLHLIPEKCFMTGLTDKMKKDFRVMKDLAQHTRLAPMGRKKTIHKFIQNINRNKECVEILANWGIKLLDDQINLEGRVLAPEAITTGQRTFVPETIADWSREICRDRVLSSVDVTRWTIIFTKRNSRCTHDFVDQYMNVVRSMGIKVAEPRYVELTSDTPRDFSNALQKAYDQNLQLAVIVFPFQREDQYSAVKRMACHNLGLPTQCIVSRTIMQDRKLRSITQKIALQINCKLGGELWSVRVPLQGLMVCGVDVYHDPSRKKPSVVGFVASMNSEGTKWHSHATFQNSGNEIIDSMKQSFLKCLEAYYKIHHAYPSSIVMYRDGVSDGMFEMTEMHEVPQMSTVFERVDKAYHPDFYYVVVQKRINTRLIKLGRQGSLDNPTPGTIMDHTITKRNYYDFLLVSQNVRQGTVTPTHYIVLKDCGLEVDKMQKLTYKMTHMYYNWPGTIRVPASCQYAHKLAYLVGENVKGTVKPNLNDSLFFL